jgi:hypothetical protein
MSSDDFGRNDPETKYTYGESDLREGGSAKLQLASSSFKPAKEARGFDPYNSGGFDRTRSWSRIRKR